MPVKIFTALLLPVLTFLTGVCPLRPEEIRVRAGEMVVLQCPCRGHKPSDGTAPLWTSDRVHDVHANDSMSADQTRVLTHGTSLVILAASASHQGNYMCSLGNSSKKFWFRLSVATAEHEENDDNKYSAVCDAQDSCMLSCPDVSVADLRALNISSFHIMWSKEGESLPNEGYFSRVDEEDQGDYTCTRSFLHKGRVYNMTFTIELEVQPIGNPGKPRILSPPKTKVFYVDLGSVMVIDCKAVVYSHFDELFWLSDTSFVVSNDSLPVFCTYNKSERENEEKHITTSLIFKNVSQEDLSRQYVCKLDSVSERSQFVTVALVHKAPSFSLPLTLSLVGIVVVIAVVVVYVKFKIHITLFLRDAIRCHNSFSVSPDGKNYDAFFMCYESAEAAGLDEDTRQWLGRVLEQKFGYRLCLYNPNVVADRAEAAAVLHCIAQSRMVVLVPTSAGRGLSSAVVNDICASLVERQNRLVVISAETTAAPTSCSLPQALDRLGKAVGTVTWKGTSSKSHTSSFFKQLRYYLSVPQHPTKNRLLP